MAEENIVTAMLREDGQLIESDDESSQGRTSRKRRSIDMLEEEHDRRNPIHRDSDRDNAQRRAQSSWRSSQAQQSEAERQDAEIRFRDKKKNVTKRMINDSIRHLQWNVDEAQYLKKRISMVENRSERLIEGLSHLVKVMDTDKNDPNMLVRDCPERFRAILNGHARQ